MVRKTDRKSVPELHKMNGYLHDSNIKFDILTRLDFS